MGFFSSDCKICGHPLLSHWATNPVNKWMEQGVAITKDGKVLKGTYDGYGRLDGVEFLAGKKPDCYHKACWVKAGEPTAYTGGSAHSPDQGYFFDPGDHDLEEPC